MIFLNLTDRDLDIVTKGGGVLKIPKLGIMPALRLQREAVASITSPDGSQMVEVSQLIGQSVAGMPSKQPGVIYITSGVVAALLKRPDVMSPGGSVYRPGSGFFGHRGLNSHA